MRKTVIILLLAALLSGLSLWAGAQAPVEAFGQSLAADTVLLDLGAVILNDIAPLRAVIDRLPALEEVRLYESRLGNEQMEELFVSYPDIFFGFTIRIKEHSIRTDQTAFSTLHNNKSPAHSSADFAPLKYCTRLEALDLGHNAIEDISFLSGLSNIKVLILALNRIEDISPLKSLPKLEYAELFRNRIRDISVLAGMENLLDLNLGYNYISDFTPLYGLKALERLWLYKSESYAKSVTMDRQKQAAIQQALPDCYIDGKTFPTGGGWREHPRYFVIFDIFKTSVYRPFVPMEGPWKP